MAKIKVLIVEDEPPIAQEIQFILESEGYDVVGIAHSSTKALDLIASRNPDIALLDISIKGDKNGVDLAHIINEKYKIPFVFVTSFSDKLTLEKVKDTYPYGYIVKPYKDKDLAPALEVALLRFDSSSSPKFPSREELNKSMNNKITKQEFTILKEMWSGKTNAQIAEEAFLSINTVKTHVSNVYLKLGVNNRSSLIAQVRSMIS